MIQPTFAACCVALFGLLTIAQAAPIGDIQAFYNAPNPYGVGILDGTVFVIDNNTASPITNGVLSIGIGDDSITADSFNVGTIPANSFVLVQPGISNDGGVGHTFFAFTGSLLDESDSGPNGDGVPFGFTGQQDASLLDTGIFTPSATAGPANDGSNPHQNVLGGPYGLDPGNDLFGPRVVAQISVVPEPSTIALAALGFIGLAAWIRRRR